MPSPSRDGSIGVSAAGFRDHFSRVAETYAAARPDYPAALFDALATHVPDHRRAWDCATGTGQAATSLAERFELVVATDASRRQIEQGRAHPRIRYLAAAAEASPLKDNAFSLVTVAQALHWLDVERFHAEVRRVVVRGGVIAVWSYNRTRVAPEIDRIVDRFYTETVGPWWPPERRHVESGYATLPFPFESLDMPALTMERSMTAAQFAAYLRTWSSVLRYQQRRKSDPVAALEPELHRAWGPASRSVTWPLAVRVGRVS